MSDELRNRKTKKKTDVPKKKSDVPKKKTDVPKKKTVPRRTFRPKRKSLAAEYKRLAKLLCLADPSIASRERLSSSSSLPWQSTSSIHSIIHKQANDESANKLDAQSVLSGNTSDSINGCFSEANSYLDHEYDAFKAALLLTTLNVGPPRKSIDALQKESPLKVISSKSVVSKITKQASSHSQKVEPEKSSESLTRRIRYWTPTPNQLANIGDKLPKAFIKVSSTGRKTARVPMNTSWPCGNLATIHSCCSITDNQKILTRDGRKLGKKKKNTALRKSIRPELLESDECENGVMPPPKNENLMEIDDNDMVYMNPSSLDCKCSTEGLLEDIAYQSRVIPCRVLEQPANIIHSGFNDLVECFYCHAHFPFDELMVHQPNCYNTTKLTNQIITTHTCAKREDYWKVTKVFKNGKLAYLFDVPWYYDNVTCDAVTYIDESNSAKNVRTGLPINTSNENIICWHCGWEYSPDIAECHMPRCADLHINDRPTLEQRRLQRIAERKLRAYNKLLASKKKRPKHYYY